MRIEETELITKAKELIKGEIAELTYNTWIRDLDIESMNENTIILYAKSDLQRDTVNGRYMPLIVATFAYLTKKEYEITCICSSEEDVENGSSTSNISNYNVVSSNFSSINPIYTFDNFVIGKNNGLAHAASLAVSEAPAKAYNPLYLYGGSGLGKTHLMHAIANEIVKHDSSKNILYVTSEEFTNEVINAIRDAKTQAFRDKYRNIDVLLIDDIQFIAGKDSVQEEFFHTFNTLKEKTKQIVVSSDKPPKDIEFLEERLRTRFEGGLMADVQAPNYETRLAILRKKADLENLVIDDDILVYIATNIDSNIRELEGALNKIIAQSTLMPEPITEEFAKKTINDLVMKKEKILTIDYIQDVVCNFFGIDKRDIKSSNRSNEISFPRQIAMYLCYEIAHQSFPTIGKEFGKRDHSTVMHGYRKIKNEIKDIPTTASVVENIKNKLLNNE